MRARNTRRVAPLRGGSAKPRTRKPTPSFPTAEQLDRVHDDLWTLVSAGEAEKVDGQLEQLIAAMRLDPSSPTAWRDGFLLLACLYCGVGKPFRTNKNAKKLSGNDDFFLLREVSRLMKHARSQEQAISMLAADPAMVSLLKLTGGTKLQRVETLRKRLRAIIKKSRGLESTVGNLTISTVEKALINGLFAEVRKNKPAF